MMLILPASGFICAECQCALVHLGKGLYRHEKFWGECLEAGKTYRVSFDKNGTMRIREQQGEPDASAG
jgi:hypothetical protein